MELSKLINDNESVEETKQKLIILNKTYGVSTFITYLPQYIFRRNYFHKKRIRTNEKLLLIMYLVFVIFVTVLAGKCFL